MTNNQKQILLSILLIISIAIAGYSMTQVQRLKLEKQTLLENHNALSQNLSDLNEINNESNAMVQQLTIELQNLNTEKLELQSALNNSITLDELSLGRLKEKGYEDYSLILDDLMNQNQLIPFPGVLGGSMAWRPENSYLLNDQWIYASFDDGHIDGHGLLKFKIREDKSIRWELVEAFLTGVE